METGLPSLTSYRESDGSYRTYEEWKHRNVTDVMKWFIVRSYRTYEEWKLSGKKRKKKEAKSSYRTYEEWKLYWSNSKGKR